MKLKIKFYYCKKCGTVYYYSEYNEHCVADSCSFCAINKNKRYKVYKKEIEVEV